MLGRIFPKQLDNDYRGYSLAIFLLALIVLAKVAISVNTIVNTRFVIETADHVPLDSFGAGAAATIVFLFKAWGLAHLLLAALGLLAMIRYRAMIPLAYLVLLLEHIGRKTFIMIAPVPIASSGSEPSLAFVINLLLLGGMLIGFALSQSPAQRRA